MLALCAFVSQCTSESAKAASRVKLEEANRAFFVKDAAKAKRACEEALQLDSDNAGAQVLLGKLYYYDRNYKKAESLFSEAYLADQGNVNAGFWLAKTRALKPESRKEALDLVNHLAARAQTSLDLMLLKAQLHKERQELPESVESLRAVTREQEKIATAYDRIAEFYRTAKLNDSAAAASARAKLLRSIPVAEEPAAEKKADAP